MTATTAEQYQLDSREAELRALNESIGATIHRRYFLGGIGVVMTLGALWGVILLLRIAFGGNFTAVGIHEVNAHGHAQISGWVGLFVMGFGYRMFPGLCGQRLPWPRLAAAGVGAMLTGIMLRSGFEAIVTQAPHLAPFAILGGLIEIAAIAVFAAQMALVLRRSILPRTGAGWFIGAGLAFFIIQAIFSACYFAATAAAANRDALLWLVSHLQGPLRDVQIHGFAMMMILGVSAWILPRWFGTKRLSPRAARITASLLILGVIGEVAGFILMRGLNYRFAAVWGIAELLLLATVVYTSWKIGVLRPFPKFDRSGKFIHAAYVWLIFSLVMLLLLPVWQFVALPKLAPNSHAVQIGFSHAYYGAIRHAITVGFISLMILGMSARMVKELHATPGMKLSALRIPFILVNLGCAMRVGFQTLTDITPAAYPFAGASGLLELTGIAIWAVALLHTMGFCPLARCRTQHTADVPAN